MSGVSKQPLPSLDLASQLNQDLDLVKGTVRDLASVIGADLPWLEDSRYDDPYVDRFDILIGYRAVCSRCLPADASLQDIDVANKARAWLMDKGFSIHRDSSRQSIHASKETRKRGINLLVKTYRQGINITGSANVRFRSVTADRSESSWWDVLDVFSIFSLLSDR